MLPQAAGGHPKLLTRHAAEYKNAPARSSRHSHFEMLALILLRDYDKLATDSSGRHASTARSHQPLAALLIPPSLRPPKDRMGTVLRRRQPSC